MNLRKEMKLTEEFIKHKYTCSCGHRVTIVDREYKICSWCGRKVYNFRNKLRNMIKEDIE